jgi:uncharacterized protein YciI
VQFLVSGSLKEGAEAKLREQAGAFNEHLAQPFRRIQMAAALRNKQGKLTGYVAVIEAQTFAEAEAYLHQSPLYAAGLYERHEVSALEIEVGAIA